MGWTPVSTDVGTIVLPTTVTVGLKPTTTVGLAAGTTVEISGDVDVNVQNAELTVQGTVDIGTVGSVVNVEPEAGSTFIIEGKTGGTAVGIAGSIDVASGTIDVASVAGSVTVENVSNTVLQVGDDMLTLVNTGTISQAATYSITLSRKGYVFGALMVCVEMAAAVTAIPYCAQAVVAQGFVHASQAGFPVSFVAPFGPPELSSTGGRKTWKAVVPLGSLAVTTTLTSIKLTIYMSAAATVATTVFGLTGNPGIVPNPDGRTRPGSPLNVSWVTTFSSKAVLAALATPLRYRIHRVFNTGETTVGPVNWLAFTQNGSAQRWYLGGAALNGPSVDFTGSGGLVCDAATAVDIVSGASHAWAGSIQYDVVV